MATSCVPVGSATPVILLLPVARIPVIVSPAFASFNAPRVSTYFFGGRRPVSLLGRLHKNKKKLPALRIASWNVRTMTAGLSDDLQQIDAARTTAIIDAELHRLDIDIAALQETRLADDGSLTEKHYTFF